MSQDNQDQDEFNNRYITTIEIATRLGVSRATVTNARKSGRLPNAIRPTGDMNIYLWVRDNIEPHIAAWELMLTSTGKLNVVNKEAA